MKAKKSVEKKKMLFRHIRVPHQFNLLHIDTSKTESNWGHFVLSFTVLIFLLVEKPFIAYTVSLNGFVYHFSEWLESRLSPVFKFIDVFFNFLLGIILNIHTRWQPQSILMSLFVCAVWYHNRKCPKPSCLVHAIGIQLPCFICCKHL